MALGIHHVQRLVPDTASNPDDTTVFAASGTNQRAYIQWVSVTVTTVQASSVIQLEDGVGGAVVFHVDSTKAGTTKQVFEGEGLRLSKNTLLNCTIVGATGGVATVDAEIRVRGQAQG